MKKRRILMGKTHLIAGAVMLAVAGGSDRCTEESKSVHGGRCPLGHAVELGHSDYY